MNIPQKNTNSLFRVDLDKLRIPAYTKMELETKIALDTLASIKDNSGNPADIGHLMKTHSAVSVKKEAYLGIFFSDASNLNVKWKDFAKEFPEFTKEKTFNHCKNLARLRNRANALGVNLFDFVPCSFLKRYFPIFLKLDDSDFAEKMAKIIEALAVAKKITKKILHGAISDAISYVYIAAPGKTKEKVATAIIAKMPEEKRRAFLMAELAKFDKDSNKEPYPCIALSESEITLPRSVRLATPTDGYIRGLNEEQNVIIYPVEGDALFCGYSEQLDDTATDDTATDDSALDDTSNPQMEFGFDANTVKPEANKEQPSSVDTKDAPQGDAEQTPYTEDPDEISKHTPTNDEDPLVEVDPKYFISDGDTLPLIECTKEGNNDNCISNGSLAYWNGTVFETLNPTAYGEAS